MPSLNVRTNDGFRAEHQNASNKPRWEFQESKRDEGTGN